MPQRMRLELLFDLGSPYSFLAFEALLRYEALWDMELLLSPIMVGVIFASVGSGSPAVTACPTKAQHLLGLDIVRSARVFGVAALQGVPSNLGAPGYTTLQANRLVIAAQQALGSNSQEVITLIRALFSSIFSNPSQPLNPSDPAVLQQACVAAGLSAAAARQLLDGAQTPAVKLQLKANTERALHAGAFGVPTMLVQHEALGPGEHLFFGSDRLEQLAHLCGLPWMGPQPQAQQQAQRQQAQPQPKCKSRGTDTPAAKL